MVIRNIERNQLRDMLSTSIQLSSSNCHYDRLPSDKSISHRTLLLAANNIDSTRIKNINYCGAVVPLIESLKQLGVKIEQASDGDVIVHSFAQRREIADIPIVNLQSSSTAARLLIGLLVGLGIPAIIDGDDTLRPRPIDWVVNPLQELGADINYLRGYGQLPVRINKANLRDGTVILKVGSAQARSAVALAVFAAGISVDILQPVLSRDHTVRLLRYIGADVRDIPNGFRFRPGDYKSYTEHIIPVDPSSIAYIVAAHVLQKRRNKLVIENVCLNPTRIGFLEILKEAGVPISFEDVYEAYGEPVGTVVVSRSEDALKSIHVNDSFRFHSMIDEIPLAAAVATQINGESTFLQAKELEFKETNRLHSTRDMLRAFNAQIETTAEGIYVQGGNPLTTGNIPCFGDHRIAMAAATLGCSLPGQTKVVQGSCYETSFREFPKIMRSYGFDVSDT